MVHIYIIRHGETESNTRFACVGRSDVPLNETGLKQAEALCNRLDVKADAVYMSPLCRAQQTIKPYLDKNPDIPININFHLIERDFGIMDDMNFDEIKEKFPDEYKKWMSDRIFYRPPEGESIEDLQKRAGEAMDKIINAHKEDNILIVTHKAIARTILAHLLGLSPEQSGIFEPDNGRIAVVDFVDGIGKLEGLNI